MPNRRAYILAATTFFVAALAVGPAQARGLTPGEVLRSGANTGAYCATYRGRVTLTKPLQQNMITRTACFPRLAQCETWLYWAQTHWSAVYLRRPCR